MEVSAPQVLAKPAPMAGWKATPSRCHLHSYKSCQMDFKCPISVGSTLGLRVPVASSQAKETMALTMAATILMHFPRIFLLIQRASPQVPPITLIPMVS